MAKKQGLKLNKKAIKSQLLKGAPFAALCDEAAHQVASICGGGYVPSGQNGKNRYVASVITKSYGASKDNLDNNTLLKAIGQVHL